MVQEEVEEDDLDLDDTAGEWRFEEEVAPQDAAAILEQMLADPTGVLTGEEAMNDGGWR